MNSRQFLGEFRLDGCFELGDECSGFFELFDCFRKHGIFQYHDILNQRPEVGTSSVAAA